jgi:F-type H+-transporting ATPase subunit b
VKPVLVPHALTAAFLLAAGLCLWPLAGTGWAQATAHESPAASQERAATAAPGHEGAAAPEHAAAGAEHGAGEHGESIWSLVWRVGNFVILAGGLWYLLRKPAAEYLEARADQIKSGLTSAAAMKAEASAQIQGIEARMKALPGEIDRLKARGAEEVAGEQVRIREAAELERKRLMEQARRDIDLQLQAARRNLTKHAAALAVDLAEKRIEREITPADQQRLVDKYVARMETLHE